MSQTIKTVQAGSEVTMHVKIMLKDKSIAQDTKQESRPVTAFIGEGDFTENFEKHLLGLKVGEKNTFMVPPSDAFGERDPRNIHLLLRDLFAKHDGIEPGTIFMFNRSDGSQVPGVISELMEDKIKVDFNHPLSGQDLIFEVEILDIDTPLKH